MHFLYIINKIIDILGTGIKCSINGLLDDMYNSPNVNVPSHILIGLLGCSKKLISGAERILFNL